MSRQQQNTGTVAAAANAAAAPVATAAAQEEGSCTDENTARAGAVVAALLPSRVPAVLASLAAEYAASVDFVYVAGGVRSTTMERLDTTTDVWTRCPPLLAVRWNHTLASLGGVLYAAGGNIAASMERFAPATEDAWSSFAPPPERVSHVTTLHDRVFAQGCNLDAQQQGDGGGASAGFYSRDPASSEWRELARMQERRTWFSMVSLGGFVYAIAGCDNGAGEYRSRTVERYEPAADQWAYVASMQRLPDLHAAAVLNGRIYVVAGTCEVYDPATNVWSDFAAPSRRYRYHSCAAANGCLYVLGDSSVERFDPASGEWSPVAYCSESHSHAAMCVLRM
jgi:hypothetical protein